jgi:hypothetical protein
MRKKAQLGIVTFLFMLGLFFLFWFVYLAGWINQVGQLTIDTNNLTGLEAFFFANLNFFIGLVLIVVLFFWSAFGGSQ